MTLEVHRAERADGLVGALGDLLAVPLPDALQTEIVSVPTRGVERWLAQTLSDRLGVCANVAFPPPGRIVADAVATACGVEPDADPWRPERSAWTLLDVVEAHLDDDWLAPLRAYLGEPHDGVRRARRLGAARHFAALFDRYALYRPELLEGWRAAEPEHWQGKLWRRLRERIGTPGPAERLARATVTLSGDPAVLDLPPRLSLFGLTRLPAGHLRILEAVARHRAVHLFLLHPSPALWDKLAALPAPPTRRRADDGSALVPANPLLASWGRDVRELQLVLQAAAPGEREGAFIPAASQLGAIQAAIRDDTAVPATTPDGSLQVHACHGRARQVEVLRDAILHALQAGAGGSPLEPRDVIVMCPDIETFAPLIQATFGGREDLRVRLADRSLRQTNPVLGVVAALLELAGARVTASEVLDLADREPVRRRFRLRDDDLARLQLWLAESGIRWGLDAEHRTPWRVETTDAGTFAFGVDRLLAGVTMSEDGARLLHGVLPLDDVDSTSIELVGAFAELVDRLGDVLESFQRPQTAAEWSATLAAAADAFTATSAGDRWQRTELQRILDELADHGARTPHDLGLQEVRALLADRLAGRPTRANFRTGHLTVCTLHPMRSVPHRVVCLLGLDDGVFPRKAPRDGDDLTLADPQLGERDPRAEDRQLLLDALMAARDKLIITFTGNDERTNARRPPAVPIGELLDLAGEGVLQRHPLQPFDPANFAAASPRSFDGAALEGATALQAPRTTRPPFLARPLADAQDAVIELEELVRFVEHPVRRFLRGRLGVEVRDFHEETEDRLDIEFDGLKEWKVGDRLIGTRLDDGVDAAVARAAQLRGGRLPPGRLGEAVVDKVQPRVDRLLAAAGTEPARSVDVEVELPDNRIIRGTVPGVCDTTLRTVTYSSLQAKPRAVAWVRLLALSAFAPDAGYVALTVMRDRSNVAIRRLEPLAQADALRHLGEIVDLYARGLTEPLPLACRTSEAYARGGDKLAAEEWESDFVGDWGWFSREDEQPEHQLVFGGTIPYAELAAKPGFADLAHALWDPILAREKVR